MKKLLFAGLAVISMQAWGTDFDYRTIAQRHSASALADDTVADAVMQGECLVGLKELNFKKKDNFDPVAEWTSFRSSSLLEQYPPCQVLIMMEVAQRQIRAGQTE